MGSTAEDKAAVTDEEACMYALVLGASSIMPMTLKNAIELGLLEVLQAAEKALLPEEVVARMPVAPSNPGAVDMVDRMLRLLSAYDVVRCQMEDTDGKYVRRYSAAPVCKWLTPNEDGVSMAALALMNQDKVLMESCGGDFGEPWRSIRVPPVCYSNQTVGGKSSSTVRSEHYSNRTERIKL